MIFLSPGSVKGAIAAHGAVMMRRQISSCLHTSLQIMHIVGARVVKPNESYVMLQKCCSHLEARSCSQGRVQAPSHSVRCHETGTSLALLQIFPSGATRSRIQSHQWHRHEHASAGWQRWLAHAWTGFLTSVNVCFLSWCAVFHPLS